MLNIAAKTRPYFGAVVLSAILLTAGGVYSYTRMAAGVYPEVTFPRIAVVAKKPDLDVRSTELLVTVPVNVVPSFRETVACWPLAGAEVLLQPHSVPIAIAITIAVLISTSWQS